MQAQTCSRCQAGQPPWSCQGAAVLPASADFESELCGGPAFLLEDTTVDPAARLALRVMADRLPGLDGRSAEWDDPLSDRVDAGQLVEFRPGDRTRAQLILDW